MCSLQGITTGRLWCQPISFLITVFEGRRITFVKSKGLLVFWVKTWAISIGILHFSLSDSLPEQSPFIFERQVLTVNGQPLLGSGPL